MGYTTDFEGHFTVDRELDVETFNLINGLAKTRRMKRNIEGYGEQGEFYYGGGGDYGQEHDETILEYNYPPYTQPGLWLHWMVEDDKMTIVWDEGEKFCNYVEWIEYLIEKILKPKDYVLNGRVEWQGEERSDIGVIIIKDNEVTTKKGRIVYDEE